MRGVLSDNTRLKQKEISLKERGVGWGKTRDYMMEVSFRNRD